MGVDLFSLDFTEWEVICLSILPAIINIIIFLYVFFFIPQDRTTIYFSLFLIFLALGQSMDGFVRMSESAEVAMKWARLDAAAWLFILPFGLMFTLRLVGFKDMARNRYVQLLIFLPTILLEFITIAQLDSYNVLPSERWNWIVNPERDLPTISIFVWMCIQATIILTLLWYTFSKRPGHSSGKSLAFLLAIGFSIPFAGGVIAEVLLPLVFGLDTVPMATSLITAFSVASIFALKRFKMLDYSPRHQWDHIIQTINEGVLIVDVEDRIMYVNSSFCSMTEYSHEEMHGRIANELLVEDQPEKVKVVKAIAERRHRISGTYELQIVTKSGKKIWLLINGAPYIDRQGNVVGSIGIHTDITYLKKAQQEILDNKRKLDTFIEESQLSIHITDPKTRKITYANPAFCDMLGYSREEVMRIHLHDFINHSRSDIDQRVADVIRNKRIGAVRREWRTRQGKVIHVLASTYYQLNADGSEAIYVTAQNISPLVETENKLIASNNELEFYVYRISHELRAPLASILGLTNVGRLLVKDKDALDIHQKIETSAKKLDNTLSTLIRSMSIKNVNDFSELIDPLKLSDEVIQGIKLKSASFSLSVHVTNLLRTPMVSSRFLMSTIFQAIIENSFRYRKPDFPDPVLNILVAEDADNIVMEFEDNGIGMSTEIQEKIFDMYFKGTYQSEGVGLGLYLVRKSMEKLGGKIKVKSNLGAGTCLTITFPRITILQHTHNMINASFNARQS